MEWKKVKLGDITIELASGGRPQGGAIDSGIPSMGAEHLNDEGGFNFAKVKYIPIPYYNSMNKGIVKRNDILLVKDGATTGKVSIVNGNFPFKNAAINEHLFQLKVQTQKSEPKYVFLFPLFCRWTKANTVRFSRSNSRRYFKGNFKQNSYPTSKPPNQTANCLNIR